MKTILLYAFVIIIALLVITSLVLSIYKMGSNTFEFLGEAVLTLGNDNLLVGILLVILVLFGLTNSIIGLFNPPNFLTNAPEWVQTAYFGLSALGTVALFYVFIERII